MREKTSEQFLQELLNSKGQNYTYFLLYCLEQNLDFDPLKNREKSKFQKSPHHFFVSFPKLSPDQISALLDL